MKPETQSSEGLRHCCSLLYIQYIRLGAFYFSTLNSKTYTELVGETKLQTNQMNEPRLSHFRAKCCYIEDPAALYTTYSRQRGKCIYIHGKQQADHKEIT